MIQFNLLPDVKLEYIKTRRIKRLVMLISSLVTAVSLTVLILLVMVVHVFQKQHLNNITGDIDRDSKAIKETPDIEKILTIQSQLLSLPDLHRKKPVTSRLFDYIRQVTPVNVSIARLDINFNDATLTVTGTASSLGDVNKFIDTLKFTEFKKGDPEFLKNTEFKRGDQELAFYDVVLGTFNRKDDKTAYTVNLKFKPAIFESIADDPGTTDIDESTHTVRLIIPKVVTTRSEIESQLEKPDDLFQPISNPDTPGES